MTDTDIEVLAERIDNYITKNGEMHELISSRIKEIQISIDAIHKNHENRIRALERWKWVWLGSALTVGSLLGVLVGAYNVL